jgi:hypothetical protein
MWYAPMCVCTPAKRQQRRGLMPAALRRARTGRDTACCTIGDAITGLGLAVGDELAVVQHDDPVGELAHHVHLVLDQEHGLVGLGLEAADQVEDHRHVVDAHARGRLVEHVDARLERHQHRHLELALVAVRQAGGRDVGAVAERHPLHQLAGALERATVVEPDPPQVEAVPRRDCTARRTFSSTERLGKSWVSWKARPRPRWVRSDTGSFVMSAPFSRTVPALARSWPEIRLK